MFHTFILNLGHNCKPLHWHALWKYAAKYSYAVCNYCDWPVQSCWFLLCISGHFLITVFELISEKITTAASLLSANSWKGIVETIGHAGCKKEIDKCVFLEKNDHNSYWELRRGHWDTTITATICISVCDCTSGSSLQHCGTWMLTTKLLFVLSPLLHLYYILLP